MKTKTVLIILLFCSVVMMVSCGDGTNSKLEPRSADLSTISEGQSVTFDSLSANSLITLNGITDSEAFNISVDSYGTGTVHKGVFKETGNNTKIVNSNGNIIPVPQENGITDFSGRDLNLGNSNASITVSKIKLSNDDTVMTHNEIVEAGALQDWYFSDIDKYGQVYTGTQYYNINKANSNFGSMVGEEVAIIQSIFNGGNYSTPDYGFIEKGNVALSSRDKDGSIHGIFKLDPQKSHLLLYNSIIMGKDGNDNMTVSLAIKKPITLATGVSARIEEPLNVYKIDASSLDCNTEYALLVYPGSGIDLSHYAMFDGAYQKSRTIGQNNNGYMRRFMIPISVNSSPLAMYIGKIDEDFIFDCNVVGLTGNIEDYGKVLLTTFEDAKTVLGLTSYTGLFEQDYKLNTDAHYFKNEQEEGYKITLHALGDGKLNSVFYEDLPSGLWTVYSDFEGTHAHASSAGYWYGTQWGLIGNKELESSNAFGIVFFTSDQQRDINVKIVKNPHNTAIFDSVNKRYICADDGCDFVFNGPHLTALINGTFRCPDFSTFGDIELICGDCPFISINGTLYPTTEKTLSDHYIDTTTGVLYIEVNTGFGLFRIEMKRFSPGVAIVGNVFVNGKSYGQIVLNVVY